MSDRIEPNTGPETNAERRQLAAELRRMRDQAGIPGRELAAEIGVSQSKVSRIELGQAMPTLPQVERWAEVTGASPEQTRSLLDLAERAFTEIHTWRTSLRHRPHLQDEIRKREAQSRMARTFQLSVIPGLLQTAEYARQVFSLSPLSNVQEGVPAAVAARMDRQLALYEPDRAFEFLITETALRWCPGPSARRLLPAQLDRVSTLSTLDNIRVGVIPDGRQAVAYASHDFVIYEGADPDSAYVTIEAIHAGLTLHDPDTIDIYEKTWAALTSMAIFDDEARAFLARLIRDLRVGAE